MRGVGRITSVVLYFYLSGDIRRGSLPYEDFKFALLGDPSNCGHQESAQGAPQELFLSSDLVSTTLPCSICTFLVYHRR